MRASISRLHTAMSEVRAFMRFADGMDRWRISPETARLDATREAAAYLASSTWRRQVYAFCIVSIYGAHERFIRDFVEESAGVIGSTCDSYGALPEKMRALHERLSLDRARDALDGKLGPDADFQQGLSNLHACFHGSVAINKEVFSTSGSNFRSKVIVEVVSRLGISLPSADQCEALTRIVSTDLNGVYGTISAVVDDLADRRNQVAHGSDFDLLGPNTLASLLDAVYAYDCWLHRSVAGALLNTVVVQRGVCIGVIRKAFTPHGGSIKSVGSLEDVSAAVRRGDAFYIQHKGLRRVVVSSIERQRCNVDIAEPGGGSFGFDFGVEVREKGRVLRLPARYANLETMLLAAQNEVPKPVVITSVSRRSAGEASVPSS